MEKNLISVAKYIYMENTRMLYSGMLDIKKLISDEVQEKIEGYRPADMFSEYMGCLSKEVVRCLSDCYKNFDSEAKEEDLLYQNHLSNFCRFWHATTKEAPICRTETINSIAYILLYFIRLEKLSCEISEEQDNDELPYLYEELCRILCGITGFQMCYLTYCHAGNYPEIFAQSGYHVKLMTDGKLLTSARMDEIVRLAKQEDNELLPGIARITAKDNCDYLVLFIPLVKYMGSGDGFYIVFQSDTGEKIFSADESEFGWIALRKARDVLFLRHRLQESLSRDYTVLINYRFDYTYVRAISEENEGEPSAMHISDLHIQQDMSAQSDNICKSIQNALKKSGSSDKPTKIDLLIISGDIVDSKDANAPRMERNYRYAEQLLNRIVVTLWQDESGYLPHDWRRRIIVTTGNHDYASMNQYHAMQKGRVLTSAMPADGESGTMSKFAYFIEFLIHYLDVPVKQLLYDDLNEVRYYKTLNLKVLMLNCSGGATPRRTNKMGINHEKVRELLGRDVWKVDEETTFARSDQCICRKPFRLVVGHYSPEYELSYFIDKFDVLPGWIWEPETSEMGNGSEDRPINNLVKVFQEAAKTELAYRFVQQNEEHIDSVRKRFMREFKNLNTAMEVLENSDVSSPDPAVDAYCNRLNVVADNILIKKCGYSNRNEAAKEVVYQIKENELYHQLDKYYSWLKMIGKQRVEADNRVEEYSEEWSEEISGLLHEIGESILMSEQDKESFAHFVNKEIKDKDLYLAGHIHAYAEDVGKNIFVADKLFDNSRPEMHGYIIKKMVKENGANNSLYHSNRFGTR